MRTTTFIGTTIATATLAAAALSGLQSGLVGPDNAVNTSAEVSAAGTSPSSSERTAASSAAPSTSASQPKPAKAAKSASTPPASSSNKAATRAPARTSTASGAPALAGFEGEVGVPGRGTAIAVPGGSQLHVRTTGSDSNPGSSTASLRSIQKAIDLATPGTTILVHAGRYTGQLQIRHSGSASAPITLMGAGDGQVVVSSTPPAVSCSSTQPAPNRTIMVMNGADNWTIAGLRIENGVYMSGKGVNSAYRWHANLVQQGNYQTRRAVPGRGVNDPSGARANLVDYMKRVTGDSSLDPIDNVKMIRNTVTGRGIHASFARYGQLMGNRITDIACGTGPGIWLITYSDGWNVSGNAVSKIAASASAHFMQEGIRLGSASNYNSVTNNTVSQLNGDGRGVNTDVDSSYNTISDNSARGVAIGFNEQMAGWGNLWKNNTVSNYRTYGFAIRLMDGHQQTPNLATASYQVTMRCNVATDAMSGAKALGIGSMQDGTFQDNSFTSVFISPNLRNYWTRTGSTWNGSTAPPSNAPGVPAGRSC